MPLTEAVKLINGKHSSLFIPFTVFLFDNEYEEQWRQRPKPSKVDFDDGGVSFRSTYTLTFDQCFVWGNEIITGKQVIDSHLLIRDRDVFLGDEQGNLKLMVLSSLTLNRLFNVSDMDAEDFVQAFVDAYKIPQMNLKFGSNSGYWEYTSTAGFKITVFDDKSLKMEKVAKASQRNFG